MSYLWSHTDWPNFKYDREKVFVSYGKYLYQRGVSDALFSSISEQQNRLAIAQALSAEIVSSSEMEGVSFQYDSVYSSIARHLDVDFESKAKKDRNAESVSRLVIDAMDNHGQMTQQRLFSWHELLFEGVPRMLAPKIIGGYRKGPVYVLKSNNREDEIVYEGVPASRLQEEMRKLLDFLHEERELNALVKSAIVSFWFVSIHPFGDGNGRISRALADYVLFEKEDQNRHYFSVSKSILKHKQEYYDILQNIQNCDCMDITRWICWYIDIVSESLKDAELSCREKIQTARIMGGLDPNEFNSRQLFMVYKLVDGSFFGKLTAEKWMKMTKCQNSTATRDLGDLVDKGILIRLGSSGKNYQYLLNPDLK